MLEIRNITKTYGSGEKATVALQEVSLSIKDRDFTVILGASGSGKSTLLYVASGLEHPDSGTVLYDGTDITALPDKKLTAFRKENVGFIFQQYYLLPHLTVYQNVKLGAYLGNNRNCKQLIEAVGLGDQMDKFPSELSGGEQQRVSIARALSKNPKVLFLDEPTGALDEKTGRQVLDYICTLQDELHFSIIMITHNSNISEMAHTVVRMNSGRINEISYNEKQKSAYEIGW